MATTDTEDTFIEINKPEIVKRLASKNLCLNADQIQLGVDVMIDQMIESLAKGDRVELRGFGSFKATEYAPRSARNPKSGQAVMLGARRVPHFKPGKELRLAVDLSSK